MVHTALNESPGVLCAFDSMSLHRRDRHSADKWAAHARFQPGERSATGGPLSPLLYVLTLEPIRAFIHETLTSQGAQPRWLPKEIPLSYGNADDLTLFLLAKYAESFIRKLQLYAGEHFLASGMQIHEGKSVIVYMQKDSILANLSLIHI